VIYGVRSDFELNFGRYLPSFGRADDDDTDTQPDFAAGSTTAHDGRPLRAREAECDATWPDWYAAYAAAEQGGTELPT
jgi:hypothetical protein